MTEPWHPPRGWKPEADAGTVVSVVTLKSNQSIRAHLIRIGFLPWREHYREVARWYYTRQKLARVNGPNSATIYNRIN